MKKISMLFAALFASVSIFAAKDVAPTAADLANYYDEGQLCVAVYFEGEICNDIVFIGTYNSWNDKDVTTMTKFEPVEGFDGWWVVAVTDESEDIQGKPVQLKSDGTFAWDYQTGDQWTIVSGTVTIEPGYSGEANLKAYDKSAPVVLISGGWKLGNNPCKGFAIDGVIYSIISKTPYCVEVSGFTSSIASNVVIPSSVNIKGIEYAVTSIGSSAFDGCTGLTSITIPEGVTSIGEETFSGCTGLTSIVWNAKNCEPTYDDGYYSRYGAFYDICSQITDFTFGENVQSIPAYCCYDMSNLTSITIPEGVTEIGEYVFRGCTGLTSIVWNAKNCEPTYDYNDGRNIYGAFYAIRSQITDFTFGENVQSIPAYCCYGMSNLTSITIPASVTSIGGSAFSGCTGLTSITIPASVTSIGTSAFSGCTGLTSITIPEGVTSIGEKAFSGCTGLTSITIPASVMSIGYSAFEGCTGLTSIVWNAKACADFSESSDAPFYYIRFQITDFTFGENVQSVPAYCCYGMSNLTSITIPATVTSIGTDAFAGCTALDTVVWNAKDCPKYAFPTEQIKSFTFGADVEVIPDGLCQGMSNNNALTELILPKIRTIGANAFNGGAPRLAKMELGVNTYEIGANAFAQCGKLTRITCLAKDVPVVQENSFYNYRGYLYVPCDVLEEYQMDMTFGSFAHVECVDAEETTTNPGEVIVIPGENDAQVTWPADDAAGAYVLEITKDGAVFCRLTFNANGQLTGIAFAPSRHGNSPARAAMETVNGWQFTVTGLDAASLYAYTMEAHDKSNNVLYSYSGEFATEGYEPEIPTSVENTTIQGLQIADGTILCNAEIRIYTPTGLDVTPQNGTLPAGVYIVRTATAAQKVLLP